MELVGDPLEPLDVLGLCRQLGRVGLKGPGATNPLSGFLARPEVVIEASSGLLLLHKDRDCKEGNRKDGGAAVPERIRHHPMVRPSAVANSAAKKNRRSGADRNLKMPQPKHAHARIIAPKPQCIESDP